MVGGCRGRRDGERPRQDRERIRPHEAPADRQLESSLGDDVLVIGGRILVVELVASLLAMPAASLLGEPVVVIASAVAEVVFVLVRRALLGELEAHEVEGLVLGLALELEQVVALAVDCEERARALKVLLQRLNFSFVFSVAATIQCVMRMRRSAAVSSLSSHFSTLLSSSSHAPRSCPM
ncbi:hypothetical protein T492DRAFT_940851 [Pavlovales sp. CCMP2436]|nr:hypothetical protein T492DRAFT_940851 [Pavlovales sp. CCMP2436]